MLIAKKLFKIILGGKRQVHWASAVASHSWAATTLMSKYSHAKTQLNTKTLIHSLPFLCPFAYLREMYWKDHQRTEPRDVRCFDYRCRDNDSSATSGYNKFMFQTAFAFRSINYTLYRKYFLSFFS